MNNSYLSKVMLPAMNLILESLMYHLIDTYAESKIESDAYGLDAMDRNLFIDIMVALGEELNYVGNEGISDADLIEAIRLFVMESYYAGAFEQNINLFEIEYNYSRQNIAKSIDRIVHINSLDKKHRNYKFDDLSDVKITPLGIIQRKFLALDDLDYNIYQYEMTSLYRDYIYSDQNTSNDYKTTMSFKLYIPLGNQPAMYSINDVSIIKGG